MKNKAKIGVMQGRLTPSNGRGIQFFPFENWENEFDLAAKLGLDEIEFIFDHQRYRYNPLWTREGRIKINRLIKNTGVRVNNICADYFMHKPFFRVSKDSWGENIRVLRGLIKYSFEIGATRIEIPLVDNSSITSSEEETILVNSLTRCVPLIEKYGVRIGFETDLGPDKFLSLIKKVDNHLIGVNYDTGNSASLGYDPSEELNTFGEYILNVHVKDRLFGGGSVELGTGDADFWKFFMELSKLDYRGSFTLQAARGEDGKEAETIRKQILFLKSYLNK